MFEIGKEYQNRNGHYVVLGIKGSSLRVQFRDGSELVLNADIQKRIIANMARESGPNPTERSSTSGQVTRQYLAVQKPKAARHSHRGTPTAPSWFRYDLWNQAIFEFFFNRQMSNQLVYIVVDDSVIEVLAPDDTARSSPEQDFVLAVKNTLGPLGKDYLAPHLARMESWKAEGAQTPPPFLGLLASFCLAAQRMQSDEGISSSNYYARLASLLLGSSYQPNEKQRLQQGFSRAHLIWQALDTWLLESSGDLGLPSAQPMSGLTHVGYPISQSLLRAQDRRKLVEFFWNSGLYPGQQVSAPDLERILDYWVTRSSLSSAAKVRWRNRSTRRKMAEIASLELSTWDGSLPDQESATEGIVTAPIALQVRVIGGPRRILDWDVVVRVPPELSEITYEAVSNYWKLPFIDGSGQSVTVAKGLSGRWSDPIPNVSIGDLLVSQVELVEREGRNKVRWQPQKVLALGWDDELKVYRSIPHLEFAKRGMVIAFHDVAELVEHLLSSADMGGMTKVTANRGIPQGWAVFENVQLRRVPDIGDDDELFPLGPEITSTVEWTGGIALPGRRQWLCSRPPAITANSIEDVRGLSAVIETRTTFKNTEMSPLHSPVRVKGNHLDLKLSDWTLPDGVYDLSVRGHHASNLNQEFDLSRQTFEIRSPDSKLPTSKTRLGHCSDNNQWPLSASLADGIDEHSTRTEIKGVVVKCAREFSVVTGIPPQVLDNVWDDPYEDLVDQTAQLRRTVEGVSNCFGGAHHFVLDPVRDIGNYRKPDKGICKFCGKRDLFGPKPYQEFLHRESTRPALSGPTRLTTSQSTGNARQTVHTSEPEPVDYDGLLEACFTLGGGSWNQFQLLALQVSSDPWFPLEAVQLLSSLGHIDVEWDKAGSMPLQWAVGPPAVVTTEHGDSFLAGHRSVSLIEVLRPKVESHGGSWIIDISPYGPTTIRISGVPPGTLSSIVISLETDGGTNWQFSDRPDQAIANALPPLWDVIGAGQEACVPSSAEYFDVETTRWAPGAVSGLDGLYRTSSFPRAYFLKLGRICRQVSYRNGKHLAGMYHRRVFLTFDPQTSQLECPLGAQLPGLYERAVVLCSGSPPEIDLRNRKVIYRRVPERIAQTVWSKITSLESFRG